MTTAESRPVARRQETPPPPSAPQPAPPPPAKPAAPVVEAAPAPTTPAPEQPAAPAPTPDPAPAAPAAPAADDIDSLWTRVCELAGGKVATAAFLDLLAPIGWESDVVSLRVLEPKQLSFAQGRRGALEELLERAAGRRVRIDFVVEKDDTDAAPTEIDDAIRAKAASNPVVERTMELFDARLIDVERDDVPGDDQEDA